MASFTAIHSPGQGCNGVHRKHVEAYLADMRERGLSPATVATHDRSLQQLFVRLVDEGEIPHSPMQRMKPPTVPEQPVPVLDDDALAALLNCCRGNSYENRRDTAILRHLGRVRQTGRASAERGSRAADPNRTILPK